MRRFAGFLCAQILLWPALAVGGEKAAQDATGLRVVIFPTSPVPGVGLPKEKIPANVRVVAMDDPDPAQIPSVSEQLSKQIGSVTLNEAQGNPLQPNLNFRGFTASPLLGLPQGLAIYQNGVRINEPFGDVVQWDLVPEFAIDSIHVIPGSSPVFGLNALGGAIVLQMKNGFRHPGFRTELSGGSFGRVHGTAEYGEHWQNTALYFGMTGFDEDGWRDNSPSDLAQFYGDFAFRGVNLEGNLSLLYADTDLNGNGAAPRELLDVDRAAVFTHPDNTRNELFFLQGQIHRGLTEQLSAQSNFYFRLARRNTLNGDAAEFGACAADPDGDAEEELCLDDGAGAPLVNLKQGGFIEEDEANGGDGVFNRSVTSSTGYGTSLQGNLRSSLFGLDNTFTLGTGVDFATVDFGNNTEIGGLTPDRTIAGSDVFVGVLGAAPNDAFNTSLRSHTEYCGLYFNETLSLTPRLTVTAAGRYNYARLRIEDKFGGDLAGVHTFGRFNPAVGVNIAVSDSIGAYASYGESNRAPTAIELSCADPAKPCRVPNAFVSDPPLADVVARTVEAGFRGRLNGLPGNAPVNWSVAGFAARNFDDIVFVSAGPTLGSGFFQNAGITQRVGIELDLNGRYGDFDWYASYAYVEATFESHLQMASPNNPAAVNDEVTVRPGDRIPGIPLHSAKLGLAYRVTPAWTLTFESVLASNQFLRGDEGNDQPTIDGYGILNVRSEYRLRDSLVAYLRIGNLFNADYETFGVFGEANEVFLSELGRPGADNRFLGPGAPAAVWAGLRYTF
ncbi:MAG: TonB-dependent receptor [Pseudomonadota bacterium]